MNKNTPALTIDVNIDDLYEEQYKELSMIHWTPVEIAQEAIDWLVTSDNTKVLDIGSGVGKFCIVGAILTKANFSGIEKRTKLVKEASRVVEELNLENIDFINDNVLNVDFDGFDSFYYFNPFCEQIAECGLIDEEINPSEKKYNAYEEYVIDQLVKSKPGTKLVTYCSSTFYPPASFTIRDMRHEGELVFWEKVQ